jgi:hypothetical protein
MLRYRHPEVRLAYACRRIDQNATGGRQPMPEQIVGLQQLASAPLLDGEGQLWWNLRR